MFQNYIKVSTPNTVTATSLVGPFDCTACSTLSFQTLIADSTPKAASKVIQDLTYTAVTAGAAGNNITVAYTSGGTAGAEVVTVTGNAISVQIQSGTSTATQIHTAILASSPAVALVSCTVSGTGSNAQTTVSATNLTGGSDTSGSFGYSLQVQCSNDGVTFNNVGSAKTGSAGTTEFQSVDTIDFQFYQLELTATSGDFKAVTAVLGKGPR